MSEQTRLYSGPESPDGAVLAEPGSVFLRVVDGAGSFYYKEQGESADGWIAVTLSGGGGAGGGAMSMRSTGSVQLADGSGAFLASQFVQTSSAGNTSLTGSETVSIGIGLTVDEGIISCSMQATTTEALIFIEDLTGTPHTVQMSNLTGFTDSAQAANTIAAWDGSANLNAISERELGSNRGGDNRSYLG